MTSLALFSVQAVLNPRSKIRWPLLSGLTLIGAIAACSTTSTGVVSRFPAGGSGAAAQASGGYFEPVIVISGTTLPDAEAALARGNALDAAARYQQAAATASPSTAAEYRLRAAEAANIGNDPARADLILDQIPAAPLDARQQSRYRLLRAQTALARNDPARALRLLPAADPGGEPAIAAAQLLVRAKALTRTGDPVGATQAWVQRERYLGSNAAISDNREALWTALNTATLDSATMGRAASAAPTVRGWMELAALARRSASLQEYDTWRKRFPGHPGEERLAALYAPLPRFGNAPPALAQGGGSVVNIPIESANTSFSALAAGSGSTALLLPQSGPLQAIGESVRAGYVSAAASSATSEPRVYDTTPGATQAYQRAVSEGAGLIVGPLRKDDATALAQAGSATVPVLALNYLDTGRPAPVGFYQFGLAPEDEARAAAEDAFSRGLQRPLALVPNTDWGNRVLAAYEQRLRELGGHVVDSGRYSGEPQNWSDPIRKLLRFNSIDDKKKAAEARAKAGPGVDPQRRNDFDMVFIAGRAAQARVLWPLFRYYHADRLPIYATAAVFEGDGDSDLSGIRFCDAPWLLDNGGPWAQLASDARSGRTLDNARLYAMGHDAFLLASRMARSPLHPGDEIPGATGTLKVDGNGAVHRGLICSQMTSGAPFVLSAPGSTP